jgi:hypothetical protein
MRPVIDLNTGPQFAYPTSARITKFVSQYKSWKKGNGKYPAVPEGVLFYYDTLFQLAGAMHDEGCIPSPTDTSCNQKIAKALVGKTYSGVYGSIAYDSQHLLKYPLDTCLLEQGKPEKCEAANSAS